jgi:chemotaxis protein CheX
MNVKYVNPFIEATQSVFREFVGLEVKPKKPFIYNPNTGMIKYDISGIIGLAGEVLGMVVISFPKVIALKTVSKIINYETKIFDEVVVDSIGELINIIAGNSKKAIEEIKIVISLPSIVKGYNHQLGWMSGVPVICIPFDLDSGEFYVFVSLKDLIV